MQTDSATPRYATPRLRALHVFLLWLPDAMPGTLYGAMDVLRTAAGIMKMQHPGDICPLTWQVVDATGEPATIGALAGSDASLIRPDHLDARDCLLIVPGLHAYNAPHLGQIADDNAPALRLMQRHMASGGWMAACYTGLVFPARLGLLDGARLAAPWAHQSWFQRSFRDCDFTHDEPMSLHDRVFTCVAPALQSQFILSILGHLLGEDVAQSCATTLLYQPRRQELTPALAKDGWLTATADSPVFRVQQWLQSHVEQPYRLAALAKVAATSERTLLRHFQQVTGMSPLDYLHALRTERAKILLEITLHDTRAIAMACGYRDATSFRRMFYRAVGMNPIQYRKRFALRMPRQHWRVEEANSEAVHAAR